MAEPAPNQSDGIHRRLKKCGKWVKTTTVKGKATFGLAAIRIYLGLARTPVDPLARSPPTLF